MQKDFFLRMESLNRINFGETDLISFPVLFRDPYR